MGHRRGRQFDDFVDSFATTRNVVVLDAGLHRVRVRAVDAGGAADIATYVLSVARPRRQSPAAPRDLWPSRRGARQRASFDAGAYDPDGDAVAMAWDLDDDGTFDDATGYVAVTTFTDPGVHHVRLQATDARGAVATAAQHHRARRTRAAGDRHVRDPASPRSGARRRCTRTPTTPMARPRR